MLQLVLTEQLPGCQIIVVSNREPYIHNRDNAYTALQTPASGVVSALEPVMRAGGGTWIAHGSGSADRETSDVRGRISVPPQSPAYTLRRIWLTEEEQKGYLRAVDAFLTRHSEWKGRFALLQATAPSRSKLQVYIDLQQEVLSLADTINAKHGVGEFLPIRLAIRHHDPGEVFKLFRAADSCLVTSLHDGMNLVAKEFVSARDDGLGVLILSSFAGASQELTEALIVNPYNTEELGESIYRAVTMPGLEQRKRMRLMRNAVRQNNVYRWAGQMLIDAASVRKRERAVELSEMNCQIGLA